MILVYGWINIARERLVGLRIKKKKSDHTGTSQARTQNADIIEKINGISTMDQPYLEASAVFRRKQRQA